MIPVVIDTSVWIDFFGDRDEGIVSRLHDLIANHNRAALCGVVLQEVLQGIRSPKEFERVRQRLVRLPFLEADRDVHIFAASIYRRLRVAGITVPSADAAIAAVAIRHGAPLFTRDRHFTVIAEHSELELYL